MTQTDVTLGTILLPYGSGRGITETLGLIDNGALRRTVNGSLVDTTRAANRKFSYSVKCTDVATPTLAGVWKGQQIVVHSAQPFRQYFPHIASVTLVRPPVGGSVVGYDAAGNIQTLNSVVGSVAFFATPVDYVKFNPILTMMVSSVTINNDEYMAAEGWDIGLEEV